MHLEVVGSRELLNKPITTRAFNLLFVDEPRGKAASSIETLSRAKARFGGEMSRA